MNKSAMLKEARKSINAASGHLVSAVLALEAIQNLNSNKNIFTNSIEEMKKNIGDLTVSMEAFQRAINELEVLKPEEN